MKKITAFLCVIALAFATCICISAANGLAFNDQNLTYAVENDLPAEPVTLEVKLRIPSGVKRGTIFGNYHWDETSNNIDFGIGASGNPVIRIRDDAKVYQYIFPNGTVPYNTWVHLTLVRDVANKKAYCYINGMPVQELDMADSYGALSNQQYKIGGNNVYINPDYFKGEIMSLAVYSDVRTATEVKSDATTSTIDKSSLMLYYDFSNASNRPATVADKSGNGNDAVRNLMIFDGGEVPASDYAYTFAVIGDTQNMAKYYPDHFNDIYNFIYDNRDAMNIEAVLGLGDITDTKDQGTIKSEWDVAIEGLKIIDDVTLNIPITGDHDNAYWYNRMISQLNYADTVTRYQPHDLRNGYIATNIGGVPYLFIQFQKGPNDDILNWASGVVEAHPNHNVIIMTHGYLYHDRTTLDEGDNHLAQMTNYGEAMWEKFIKKHSNIVLVLSGHIGYDYAVVNQRKGTNGNTVTEMLFDFQSSDKAAEDHGISENGLGVVNLFHFSADGKTLTVETYSTVLDKYFMEINQFTVELDTANNKTYVKPSRTPTPPRDETVVKEPAKIEKAKVIYQNDFSNASTLSDFTQYRAKWEIKNGRLYMTSTPIGGASSANYGHIVYNGGHDLENYIIDVDFYNACTQSGVIFRTFEETLSHEQNGFNGYFATTSSLMTHGALASAVNNTWVSKLLDQGLPNDNAGYGVNLHFNVIVDEDLIKVNITNKDTGKLVYNGIYSVGTKKEDDPHYFKGSFGFRMQAKYSGYTATNNSYFDNLVVTSFVEKPTTPVVPVDISEATEVYRNTFDNASALNDFVQYYGTWEVKDGRLHLTSLSQVAALCLYKGDAFKNLTDYVVDVDMYNIQSQGGVVMRSQVDRITGSAWGNDFYGYTAFVSTDGLKAAIGYGLTDGSWGGNIDVSNGIMSPGANVHIHAAVKSDVITYKITNIKTGKLLWECTERTGLWDEGTFGFRLSGYTNDNGTGNVNNVSFDNLVVSTIPHHHVFSEWQIEKAATYTEKGERFRVCLECDYDETEVMPKLEKLNVDVTVDSVSVNAGETVTVTLKVKNTVGYSSLSFAIPFDSSLVSLKNISKANLPSGFSVSTVPVSNRNGKISVSYSGSALYVGEFSIALTFSTKYSVNSSSAVLAVANGNASYTHVQGTVVDASFNVTNGTVSIIGQVPPIGDSDFDGKVTVTDVINAVTSVTSGEYLENADYNKDGKITLLDIVAIIRDAIK